MTSSTSPMVEIKDLHKRFGKTEVLRGVDLQVPREQVAVILGPSGSGKSTLLRCVAALEPYTGGRITIDGELMGYREDGERLVALTERQLARQRARLGMVFQGYNLFPHRTVLDNVTLALTHVQGVPQAQARSTALTWLERVGLADRAKAYPYQLSGGQQQRVAIARAVAIQPKVLLLDEITSALDPELVGEVLQVVKDLAHSGVTMLVVTHEILFAAEVADQIIFIDEGGVVETGPSERIVTPTTDRFRSFLSRYEGVLIPRGRAGIEAAIASHDVDPPHSSSDPERTS